MATDCAKPNLEEVEKFNRENLKKSETTEKSGAVAGYAQEKTLEQVGKFDKNCLKHVDTQEKNPLPSQAEIEAEKSSGF